ncbi:2'-5' RNA ligase family protein [Patescibacteria group bacterium]|nr:2'-5' RNA ligase family protein [Patescibacteria group bacterium]
MYVPHMSLVYGNLDLAQRFTLAQSIKLPVTKFLADRICVVRADSLNPKTWKKVAEFTL